jgi:hypothetical protein
MEEKKSREKIQTKLAQDKTFMLTMLEDPVKACIVYGINIDEKAAEILSRVAADSLKRANEAFKEVINGLEKGCNACNNCCAPMIKR